MSIVSGLDDQPHKGRKMRTFAICATAIVALSACSPTYLRDGREANADGTYGHYAGTCNPGVIVNPTICFGHFPDGREVVISGPNAAANTGALLSGAGMLAGGVGELAYGLRYLPDINYNSNTNRAPTTVSGSPVNVSTSNYAAGGAGGRATAYGGASNSVSQVSNTTRNLNRISLTQANLQIANQRQSQRAQGGVGGQGGQGGAGGIGQFVDP